MKAKQRYGQCVSTVQATVAYKAGTQRGSRTLPKEAREQFDLTRETKFIAFGASGSLFLPSPSLSQLSITERCWQMGDPLAALASLFPDSPICLLDGFLAGRMGSKDPIDTQITLQDTVFQTPPEPD